MKGEVDCWMLETKIKMKKKWGAQVDDIKRERAVWLQLVFTSGSNNSNFASTMSTTTEGAQHRRKAAKPFSALSVCVCVCFKLRKKEKSRQRVYRPMLQQRFFGIKMETTQGPWLSLYYFFFRIVREKTKKPWVCLFHLPPPKKKNCRQKKKEKK